MNSPDQIVDQIRQIKNQYEAQVTGKHKQWPRAIKERVVALVEMDLSLSTISERTGISYHTIASWTAQPNRSKFREMTVAQPTKSVAVTVTSKRPVGRPPKKLVPVAKNCNTRNGTVTIMTPGGYLVEGLDAEVLAEFFKRMGAT
jgi:transposase-like protein